jgi:hypothetical protein
MAIHRDRMPRFPHYGTVHAPFPLSVRFRTALVLTPETEGVLCHIPTGSTFLTRLAEDYVSEDVELLQIEGRSFPEASSLIGYAAQDVAILAFLASLKYLKLPHAEQALYLTFWPARHGVHTRYPKARPAPPLLAVESSTDDLCLWIYPRGA